MLLNPRRTFDSPALAAADLANDAETAALMQNPFLADLGAYMQPGSGGAGGVVVTADDLLDDAAFARLMSSVVDTDASTASTASTANTAASTAVFSGVGVPAVRLKTEPADADSSTKVPQIDGGTGGLPTSATASTASTAATGADDEAAAAAAGVPLTGADRVDLGSSDDDSEVNAAVGGDHSDIRDFVVCLYEGVKRTKTRSKLSLTDGVASVQGVDYVFRKATGEIDFAAGSVGGAKAKSRNRKSAQLSE